MEGVDPRGRQLVRFNSHQLCRSFLHFFGCFVCESNAHYFLWFLLADTYEMGKLSHEGLCLSSADTSQNKQWGPLVKDSLLLSFIKLWKQVIFNAKLILIHGYLFFFILTSLFLILWEFLKLAKLAKFLNRAFFNDFNVTIVFLFLPIERDRRYNWWGLHIK